MRKEKEKREKILTIATGYPGVQTFPTPSPPRLFISEREVGVGIARKKDEGRQGPKLTFLYRRQVATENFFQSPNEKIWSPKSGL